MPVTTFLAEHQLNQPTGDDELDELLAEAKQRTGKNYQIVMHKTLRRSGLFGLKKQVEDTPALYVEVGGVGPWQAFMCAQNRATVGAFLLGMLNGIDALAGQGGSDE